MSVRVREGGFKRNADSTRAGIHDDKGGVNSNREIN
jgi:hypothetical protein